MTIQREEKKAMTPEQHAQKILSELKIREAPVPVEDIAARLGAKISFEPFEGKGELSGMLLRDKGQTVIGINSSHPTVRQRFSIAHEIGHLVMHQGSVYVDQTVRFNRDSKSSMAIDPEEIQANGFAAELLMPEKLVTASVKRRLTKRPNVSSGMLIAELALEFEVSTQAMEYRLTNLGII
jgi:Zn-dependent peptidase ImmA (M78 family)